METMESWFGESREPADEDKNEAPGRNINAAETDEEGAHYRTATELSSGLHFSDDRVSIHNYVCISTTYRTEQHFTAALCILVSANFFGLMRVPFFLSRQILGWHYMNDMKYVDGSNGLNLNLDQVGEYILLAVIMF